MPQWQPLPGILIQKTRLPVTASDPTSTRTDRASAYPLRTSLVFWVAWMVRVLYLTLAHTYRIRAFPGHFEYGWEMGRIGRALATGYGFADPFDGHTGPTAWVGPLYPLLVGLVFRLTGVYTALSAWILLALNSLAGALTLYPMAAIGRRCFFPGSARSANVARWAMWIWALYPAAMQYDVRWVWETSGSTLLFTCAFALALRMHDGANGRMLRDWVLFGALWGAIALSNPALVVFLPLAGLWVLWEQRSRLFPAVGSAGLSAVVFLAILTPWVVRNARVMHHFVPLRANFGAELALGDGPGATGLLMEYHHPAKDPEQLRLYRAMGEYRYAQMRGAMARRTIAAAPGLFLTNTLKRLDFFWFGVPAASDLSAMTRAIRSLNYGFTSTAGLLGLLLALRRRSYGAWLFACAFLSLPAVYYLVTVHARFRHPLEPLIALLGVFLFQSHISVPKHGAPPRSG